MKSFLPLFLRFVVEFADRLPAFTTDRAFAASARQAESSSSSLENSSSFGSFALANVTLLFAVFFVFDVTLHVVVPFDRVITFPKLLLVSSVSCGFEFLSVFFESNFLRRPERNILSSSVSTRSIPVSFFCIVFFFTFF